MNHDGHHRQARRAAGMSLAAALLAACAAPPERPGGAPLGTIDVAADHAVCAGAGALQISIGAIEGGLEGAAVMTAYVADGADNEITGSLLLAGAVVGGTLGAGVGALDETLHVDRTFADCLRAKGYRFREPDADRPWLRGRGMS